MQLLGIYFISYPIASSADHYFQQMTCSFPTEELKKGNKEKSTNTESLLCQAVLHLQCINLHLLCLHSDQPPVQAARLYLRLLRVGSAATEEEQSAIQGEGGNRNWSVFCFFFCFFSG